MYFFENFEIVAISTDKIFFNGHTYKVDIGQHFHKSKYKFARVVPLSQKIKTNLTVQKEQNSTNLLLWPPICRNKPAITPKWFNSLDTYSSYLGLKTASGCKQSRGAVISCCLFNRCGRVMAKKNIAYAKFRKSLLIW